MQRTIVFVMLHTCSHQNLNIVRVLNDILMSHTVQISCKLEGSCIPYLLHARFTDVQFRVSCSAQ